MILCGNPQAQYLAHREAIDQAIARVLASTQYIQGDEVLGFEAEFAAYLGVEHAVAVANGTDAIHVALRAAGIGPGDEVITTAHTAVATVAAIELAGATPVFADIEADHYTLRPDSVQGVITPATRAIVAVHLYGQAADLTRLSAMAQQHGLLLLEDCAQAHGATWQSRRLGSIGRLGCFSFYPTKNLGAIGDGGMVVTNDQKLAERCRLLREYGWNERRESQIPGLNSRLDPLQAAILRVKLAFLDADNERRARVAKTYDDAFAGGPWALPARRPDASHVFHLYVVRGHRRDALLAHLRDHGVGAAVHYATPVHLQPAYRGRIRGSDALPETERAANEILSLPVYPELGARDMQKVIDSMLAFAKREAS